MKKTKAELKVEIEQLKNELEHEKSRPTGHTVSNVDINMANPDPTKIAIAEAVKEGMKALQNLNTESNYYGIYFSS